MKDIDRLRVMVEGLLARELPTQSRIREIIAEVRPACPAVTDGEAEDLALEFEAVHGVRMTDGASLQDPEFEPWLDGARSDIEFYYWNRYRRLMAEKGLSGQVLGGLGNVTDRILGLLENPEKAGRWDRRGMVMGHVQSGKTANYIGVVAKAADAGYRVIIIIAGLQNKLRNQTQRRVDEGFIGFSSTAGGKQLLRRKIIGVGRYDSRHQPIAFTTSHRDFHKGIAESLNIRLQELRQPAVFVIKKNPNTLRNLIDWLKTHNAQLGTDTIQEPMLLIDDEADNASINIKHRMDEISRINGQIRELLDLFERSNYVGYTATPFANIFIDPDSEDQMAGHDLFPRDFIVSLDPPTNYFGAARVFRDSADSVLRDVDDHEDLLPTSHKIDHVVTGLPESLEEAVRVFILARAIRLARGQDGSHNSMLVNVSRFVAVQQQVRNEVQAFVDQITSSVRINGARPANEALQDPEIAELHRVYQKHYEDVCDKSWLQLQGLLHASVSAVSIVEINSRAAGSLDYSEYESSGLNVIAVGGLSLSRGLTLEGLTVSYFLRRSMMYDTLFQMGRWFGYRDGYDDLCRVWMPEEAQGWYDHIAESIDELRDELARMQSANATPRDFGLKVRSHPDTLVVTARNKMGSGQRHTVLIGLANHFVETAILHRDETTLNANLRAAVRLADTMRAEGHAPEDGEAVHGGRLVRDVPVKLVDAFLGAFRNHPGSPATESDPVRRYIGLRAENELNHWDVLIAGVQRSNERSLVDDSLGFPLVCQRRTPGKRSDRSMLMVTNKQRVSSRGITKVGLTEPQIRAAETEYDANRPPSPGGNTNYPDRIYTRIRTKPLLVIHLLAIGKEIDDLSKTTPVAAWSISFPETGLAERTVEYVVNTTWFQEHYGDDDSDDDENGDDDY